MRRTSKFTNSLDLEDGEERSSLDLALVQLRPKDNFLTRDCSPRKLHVQNKSALDFGMPST